MELTKEQIEFLDKVCYGRDEWKLTPKGEVDVNGDVDMRKMNLTKIPVKFGRVGGTFWVNNNQLSTLQNCPDYIGQSFHFGENDLTDYFKNIKEEDFPHWGRVNWAITLREYPFLINIAKKYFLENGWLKYYLIQSPSTKLYYRD
jgi:hypothetical protein